MARPLSEEKRTAILEATAEVVAMLGVSAPTAKIAKEAGVAEGTLFTYFANKDELLNRLYLELKMDLRDAMMTGYPAGKSLIVRNRHVWDRFIGWGSAHPLKRMLGLGLHATVNSDDPAYFGGYLAENWLATAAALGMTRGELTTLARNSFTGSFLTPHEAAPHLAAIEAYVAANP